MAKKWSKLTLTFAVGLAVSAPASVFATNGYFSHGFSVKEKALAGAGVAFPQDSLAAANNPAGMVFVGKRLDVGAALFSPNRDYTTTGASGVPLGTPCAALPGGQCPFEIGPQSLNSENDLFLIPQFGRNWMIGNNSSAGLSIYGNGGMNTEWEGGTASTQGPLGTFTQFPGTFGSGTAGVDLAQIFFNGSYARKFGSKGQAAWGVSGIIAVQSFEAKGLEQFAPFSTNPSKLSNNSHEITTGFGFKVGIQGKVTSKLALGASYQSEIDMDEFEDYAGLFAENGGFDIPATYTVGLVLDVTERAKFVLDIQEILYSDVPSIANPFSPLLTQCMPGLPTTGGTGPGCLGGPNGAGFGWEDMTVVKLGYQWRSGSKWTWRVGFSTGDQPIPSSEVLFNILAPGVMEEHVTFGFTRTLGKSSEVNFAAMVAPNNSITGANPLDPAQTIELEMQQWELAATWGKKF
ncbi:MAG: OmpP1/FadL family transporter [Acidiferrobacterales bacterium]